MTFSALVGQVERIATTARVISTAVAPPSVPRAPTRTATPVLTVVRDEETVRGLVDGVSAKQLDDLASGRRLPEREIDLHGLRAARAREVLTRGVQQARHDGVRYLLVICGRGTHSDAGPVLPEVAIERLSELGGDVLSFCTAPVGFGGGGALLVQLRTRER
jgi:DNA-nicking Smr family endonuclease